jgi:hypothetical protein
MKKQSDTWILLLVLLNLPPDVRYKSGNVIIVLATPGPKAPGNIESFILPLFQETARASEGIWIWDALKSSYFVLHVFICMILGDMLGSAKLSGMAGHTALHGCRFSDVLAAKSSVNSGSKSLYYPMNPPENDKYNPTRPAAYDLNNLPMRTEQQYWATISALENAPTKAARAAVVKKSGISRMPLCAASKAFLHPSFFPLDPFHLFYENCMAFIWDLWTVHTKETDPVHISSGKIQEFGKHVASAMSTLSPRFCGPVRDPHLKRQSQYKAYEWMALLHWYIIPIGIELEFPPVLLRNFAKFSAIVDFAMKIKPRTYHDIARLHNMIRTFLLEFEEIYVGKNPENISRCRLCIFQLIHVPQHIEWYGSVRIGSQSTVERAIGEMGQQIRSKKAPFSHLGNLIFERELLKVLLLYYPELDLREPETEGKLLLPLSQKKIRKTERKNHTALANHISALCTWLGEPYSLDIVLKRWSKLQLVNGDVLSSLSLENQPDRVSNFFQTKGPVPVFGYAVGFFQVHNNDQTLVLFHYLANAKLELGTHWVGQWSKDLSVIPASEVDSIVSIWMWNENRIYILQKHPGLGFLTSEERGVEFKEDAE